MLKNANWAMYNLAVSKRKETEPTSSSMWNINLPGEPMVDFDKFFDGENITQEDLVAWINVGTHHLVSGCCIVQFSKSNKHVLIRLFHSRKRRTRPTRARTSRRPGALSHPQQIRGR